MAAAELFDQALTTTSAAHRPGRHSVSAVDVPLARQAIDLHLSMGGDVMELLQPYWWHEPAALLSLAFDGADLDRECRLFACWCARPAIALVVFTSTQQSALALVVATAERYARGEVSDLDRMGAQSVAFAIEDTVHRSHQDRKDALNLIRGVTHVSPKTAARWVIADAARVQSKHYSRNTPYAPYTNGNIPARSDIEDQQQRYMLDQVVAVLDSPAK